MTSCWGSTKLMVPNKHWDILFLAVIYLPLFWRSLWRFDACSHRAYSRGLFSILVVPSWLWRQRRLLYLMVPYGVTATILKLLCYFQKYSFLQGTFFEAKRQRKSEEEKMKAMGKYIQILKCGKSMKWNNGGKEWEGRFSLSPDYLQIVQKCFCAVYHWGLCPH